MDKQYKEHWHNWSGRVRSRVHEIVRPNNVSELVGLLSTYGREGRQVRVVGSAHSFTPLVDTKDVLISLDNMQGVEEIDMERGTATVLGGTKLHSLGQALFERGLAQENLGDIDVQSIAGAISTGTHGTGIHYGSLSTQVEGFTLVTASGDLLECSQQENPEIFKAAQVSLGSLGVIAKIKLRVVPAKRMRFQSSRQPLDDCLENLERSRQENSHFEFYWFPYTEWVQAKYINETDTPVNTGGFGGTLNKILLENGLFWLLSESCRLVPALSQTVSHISALGITNIDETNYSHRLFATPRWVRFNEMEYNIPVEHATTVIREIQACIEKQRFAVHFPMECRFVHEDDIWLSPAYERASCYIAVHMYRGMPYHSYFYHIEEIFKRYQGRPHWGKLHTQHASQLAALYPRWQDFQRVRSSLDPQGIFLNSYLRDLFDVSPTQSQVPARRDQRTL